MTTSPRRGLAGWFVGLGSAVLVIPLLLCASCGYLRPSNTSVPGSTPVEDAGPPLFEDATDALGLDFVHDPGPTDTYFMPQSMGSGGAFIQDPDGTLYIYLLQGAGPTSKSVNRLYRLEDGKFRDVTEGSGLGIAGYNTGVAIADVNNDGLPDVLVSQYGGIKLFLNLGKGKFVDVTDESGLSNPLWGASAAFLDYDRDGWLDLVVVNYLDYDPKRGCLTPEGHRDFCGPKMFRGTCSKLFHNLGSVPAKDGKPAARVRFEDVSFASGIGRLPGPGLGVVCADFDGDGWPDIFISNDGQPNRLWINRHNGTFVDEAVSRGVAYNAMSGSFAGMGIAIGDTTNSGRLDLFVTHLGLETHTLWRQESRGHFRDRTVEAELAAPRGHGTGFGTLFADFNLDGNLDLAIANGRVFRGGPAKDPNLGFWETYAERNQLFVGDGTGKFRDVSSGNKALCGDWNVARGLACADINGDGAPDLLVTTIGGRARLLRNVAPNRGHWLKVRAVFPLLKDRDAYGAEVRVRAGGRQFLRLVNPAESYQCSSLPTALFGLGPADNVEAILVTWPDDGSREEFDGGAVDRAIVLRKGEGRKP